MVTFVQPEDPQSDVCDTKSCSKALKSRVSLSNLEASAKRQSSLTESKPQSDNREHLTSILLFKDRFLCTKIERTGVQDSVAHGIETGEIPNFKIAQPVKLKTVFVAFIAGDKFERYHPPEEKMICVTPGQFQLDSIESRFEW